jgi:hypothetical protein
VGHVFDLQQSAGLETAEPSEIRDNHSRDEQGSAAGKLGEVDEMEEARKRGAKNG